MQGVYGKNPLKTEYALLNGGFLEGKQLLEILCVARPEAVEKLLSGNVMEDLTAEELLYEYRKMLRERTFGLEEREINKLGKHTELGLLGVITENTGFSVAVLSNGVTFMGDGKGGGMKRLGFSCFSSSEEVQGVIRLFVREKIGRDFTMQNPRVDLGWFRATRPPVGEWEIRVYGRRKINDENYRLLRNSV